MSDTHLVRFISEGLEENALVLTRLNGREAISSFFELVVEFEPHEAHPLTEEQLGKLLESGARVMFDHENQLLGMIRRLEVLPWEEGDRPVYRATLVPSLWANAQTPRSRVFQDKNVVTIIRDVLEGLKLEEDEDFSLKKVTGTYRKREYTVQYEESDLAFISRLAEDEGIFFYFDCEEDESIVFADNNDGLPQPHEHAAIKHKRRSELQGHEPAILAMARDTRMLPAKLTLFDYNWRKPSLELEGSADVDEKGRGTAYRTTEHWSFGENLDDAKAGENAAKLRAQELKVARERWRLTTTSTGVRAGMRIGVEQTLHTMFDRKYLVVGCTYEVVQPPSWRTSDKAHAYIAELDTIDATIPFRPARVTPKPHIFGLVYGIVDGPEESEHAYLDDKGRYKVALTFDVQAAVGGKASCWIRRAQPYAGASLGMHFPLLAGTEVAIAHVGGDPDRPIIVGALSNAETPGPVANKNATSNIIRTTSGIRMHFEDDA